MTIKLLLRFGLTVMLALVLTQSVAGPAAAAEFQNGETITIGTDQVIDDDLFLSGNTVVMNGTVNGNLFVVGSKVEVKGTVNGSIFAGAQSIAINGKVGGSLYVGAANLTLGPQAVIARNAMAGLYNLTSEPGSSVKRDLYVGGYQAVIGGEIARDLKFGGAALVLNGKIGRNVQAEVSEPGTTNPPPFMSFGPETPPAVFPGLKVSPEASIGGKLEYASPADQSGAIQAKPAGGISYIYQAPTSTRERQPQANPFFVILSWVFERAREFATLFVLGLLALWKLPDLTNSLVARAQSHPLPAAGWGLLVLIGGFIVAFLAAVAIVVVALVFGVITLGGLAWTITGIGFSALGLVFSIFMFLVSFGAKLVVAYLAGNLILDQFNYGSHRVWALFVGVLVIVLVTSIPILGGLIGLTATVIGLGALWLIWREQRPTVALHTASAAAN